VFFAFFVFFVCALTLKGASVATQRRVVRLVGLLALVVGAFVAGWLVAKTGMGASMDPALLPQVEREFIEKMRGAAMVGRFTIAGREDRVATPDRYDIYSVDKVGADQWRFNAKIGESGVTLPIVVTMKFVDDTPLILMTDATIPGMGTFTARVFFHGEHYAGTWFHAGRGGGHMFGKIERAAAQP
jgi:hypothetical protein